MMKRHTFVLALALVAAACTTPGTAPAPEANPAPAATVLAFADAAGVATVDAAGRVTRLAGTAAPAGGLHWSPDGSRLAWQERPRDKDVNSAGAVSIVENGTVRRLPCACNGVGFLRDDLVALSSDGEALFVFPPGAADPRRLPLSERRPSGALIAGGADAVILGSYINEAAADFRSQYELLTVDSTGKVDVLLGRDGKVSTPVGVPTPASSRRFAWIDAPSSGACALDEDLRTIDLGDGSTAEPGRPADAAFAAAQLTDGQRSIISAAPAGGGIVVTYGPRAQCQPVYAERLVTYLHSGADWQFIGTGMLAVGFGADGRSARITAVDPAPTDASSTAFAQAQAAPRGLDDEAGRLSFTDARGATTTLAERVSSFTFTPAEIAAAVVPAAAPAAAATTPTTDWQGAELPRPFVDLFTAIHDAATTGDVASLLRLCARCDDSTVAWIKSDPGAPAALARLTVTHARLESGSAVLPSFAPGPCTDRNGLTATCTAEQFADITTLGMSGEYSVDYSGPSFAFGGDRFVVARLAAGDRAEWTGTAPAFALGLGGTVGERPVFADAEETLTFVRQSLGRPESDSGWIQPECGPVGDVKWRLVRWGAFEMLLIDSAVPRPDGTESTSSSPHVAGWTYRAQGQSVYPVLRTAEALTLGSTRSDVEEAFPNELTEGPPSTYPGGSLALFRGDFNSMTFEFDAELRIVEMTSGQSGCGD